MPTKSSIIFCGVLISIGILFLFSGLGAQDLNFETGGAWLINIGLVFIGIGIIVLFLPDIGAWLSSR